MGLLHKLTRKKTLEGIALDTSLHRCLSTLDLTLMGIGAMVGSGIYIMTGVAAKELAGPGIVLSLVIACVFCVLGSFSYTESSARVVRTGLVYQTMYVTLGEGLAAVSGWLKVIGPSIVLSFVVAAVIAVLGVLCFTEFAARVPRAGGSYTYMYASLGELAAFVMGWGILVSTVTGAATNARAWSAYLDFLTGNAISNYTQTHFAEWTVGEPIAPYPDFMASVIIIVLMLVTISGANCSTKFNSVFAGGNCLLLLFVIIVGFIYAEPKNWTNPDTKGFLPFGWSGVLSGAGACYWALTGYEIIGTCTEEAKDPKKSVPLSMGLAISIVTLLYIGTSASLTLLCPYTALDIEAPLPSAFHYRGITWASYVVSVGPLLGLTTTLFASIFSFTRITYAMAEDGLLMPLCSNVATTGVPVWSAMIGSVFMAIQACFFDIRHIISFGVILSLFQLILVSASVIILRYRPSDITKTHGDVESVGTDETGMAQNILSGAVPESPRNHHPPGPPDPLGEEDASPSPSYPDAADTTALLENGTEGRARKKKKRRRKRDRGNSSSSESQRNGKVSGAQEEEREILPGTLKPAFRFLDKYLNFGPGVWVCGVVGVMWLIMLLFAIALMYGKEEFEAHVWWSTATAVVLIIFLLVLMATIVMHKQNISHLVMKVPCVPFIPSLSILTSTILMVATANYISWIGFAIVFIVGVLVYLSYGIRHSKLNQGSFEVLPMSGGGSLFDSAESEDEL